MFEPPFRAEFPILESSVYLNSCSLGALSRRSEEYLEEFLCQWHQLGASAWYELWLGRIENLRRRAARAQGADPTQVALMPSTSVALSAVAESTGSDGTGGRSVRNRVVCTELDFPTLLYQWYVRPEVDLVVLPSPDGVRVDPEQFREVVDERTRFVATSHVFYSTGFVQDITTLARIAREAGALTLIDGYQAPGQIPVDLRDTGVDFYTWGPLKWLCGGPGLAYLYVKDPLEWQPRTTSWFAHRRQFDFDIGGFEPHGDARRFEMGTPALPTVHTALGGQEVLDEVGIRAVLDRNRELSQRLAEGARSAGFELTWPRAPESRSAIVMIRHPDPAEAVRYLAEHEIIVDHRPGHVRVSPHFYNTTEEMERFVEVLARSVRSA